MFDDLLPVKEKKKEKEAKLPEHLQKWMDAMKRIAQGKPVIKKEKN